MREGEKDGRERKSFVTELSVAVPQISQNLHQLDWQNFSHLRNAVFGQCNRLEAERPLTQTSFRLAADRLSCALPPHFGRWRGRDLEGGEKRRRKGKKGMEGEREGEKKRGGGMEKGKEEKKEENGRQGGKKEKGRKRRGRRGREGREEKEKEGGGEGEKTRRKGEGKEGEGGKREKRGERKGENGGEGEANLNEHCMLRRCAPTSLHQVVVVCAWV